MWLDGHDGLVKELIFRTALVKLDTELGPTLNESGYMSNRTAILCKNRWEFIGTSE